MMHVLKAGTVLLHGTNDPEFDEAEDDFTGPAWLTDSQAVAARFAQRNLCDGGKPRILQFVLENDLEVHLIQSSRDCEELSETHGISFTGVEDMRDSVLDAGIPGWIIPNNYPEGADILIADTSCLRYVSSTPLARPSPAATRRPKP